jgi:hypothetical protein
MAGFGSYSAVISALNAGARLEYQFYKVGPTNEGAGVWTSLWYAGSAPAAGTDPAATPGTAYTNAAGSIQFPNTSTATNWMLDLNATATQDGTLMLYDRLVGVSGLSVATTGNKTVSSTGLPRYTSSAASVVEAWLEVTTATTTTAAIVSMNSYTNEGGTTGRAGGTVTFPATATDVRTMIKMPLQAGDKGVQACSTINVATAAAAGVVNFVLLRPIMYVPLLANIDSRMSCLFDASRTMRVFDGASLAFAWLATGTTAATITGDLRISYA